MLIPKSQELSPTSKNILDSLASRQNEPLGSFSHTVDNARDLATDRVPTPHQRRLKGIALQIADGYGSPRLPHVVAMQSLDFWLIATPEWRDTHDKPILLFGAMDQPEDSDITVLRKHSSNMEIWAQYDDPNPDAVAKFSNHLWAILSDMVDEAQRLTKLAVSRPSRWRYSDLDVRIDSPGLTSGFFSSLLYMSTKRDLMRLQVPGFFEWPGERVPLVTYSMDESHLWAGVSVKSDTPIGDSVDNTILREVLKPSRDPGIRWHKIPIAHCDSGWQAQSVEDTHRLLCRRWSNDTATAELCEEWVGVWEWWSTLTERFRLIDPYLLKSPTCERC